MGMTPERKRALAAWAVIVFGGIGAFVAVSALAGHPVWTLLPAYILALVPAVAAGVIPIPGHPLSESLYSAN
jgi:hypothetical protein